MNWLSKGLKSIWGQACSLLGNQKGIAWLPILLALGGGYLLSQLTGKKEKPKVSGDYPEGEVLGEYPGGLMTFETLTPDQKKIMRQLMGYMLPRLGLPSQAFGQAPAGTTAGVGTGAGSAFGAGGQGMPQGMAQSMMPMLTQLLGMSSSSSSSTCAPRTGGR
jgi:hypothetical protein